MNRKFKYYVKDLASFMLYPAFLQKTKKNYLALCCIVKDENEYLAEWIWYHQKVGVQQFYIFDNNSKVPVAETLKQFIVEGHVKVNVIDGKNQQMVAYSRCLEMYGEDTQWIAFLDGDEFLVPKTTTNLCSILKRYEKFGGLGVNWIIFGSSAHVAQPTGRQIENFLGCSLPGHPANTHIKSIVQPRFVKGPGGDPHHFIYKPLKYCVNELFDKISGARTKTNSTQHLQINHYYLRSQEEFKAKIERGHADKPGSRCWDDFYNFDADYNKATDSSILKAIDNET